MNNPELHSNWNKHEYIYFKHLEWFYIIVKI